MRTWWYAQGSIAKAATSAIPTASASHQRFVFAMERGSGVGSRESGLGTRDSGDTTTRSGILLARFVAEIVQRAPAKTGWLGAGTGEAGPERLPGRGGAGLGGGDWGRRR